MMAEQRSAGMVFGHLSLRITVHCPLSLLRLLLLHRRWRRRRGLSLRGHLTRGLGRLRLIAWRHVDGIRFMHGFLESFYRLPQALAELRQLAGAENDQH